MDAHNDSHKVLHRIVIATHTRLMSSIDKHTHIMFHLCVNNIRTLEPRPTSQGHALFKANCLALPACMGLSVGGSFS